MVARLGATPLDDDLCRFVVWAPNADRIEVVSDSSGESTTLERNAAGYHQGVVQDMPVGTRYRYRLDGDVTRPDPASRLQPLGVHGDSEVVDLAFEWKDHDWSGLPLSSYVFYELHVGTFTPKGTFDAVEGHLDELRELGVTAIELMPVAQFPGDRNWGYDGVYPFAVQASYGGPRGLQRLVNASHRAGLAVVLDVVYNHLGPEGNYLGDFGPYFTDVYKTPWGAAINFDGPFSDHVRRYFIENALQWFRDFHVDALRLDAVHAIVDRSAFPFLEQLSSRVRECALDLGRPARLIAESDDNDPRLVQNPSVGGLGIDSMWCDDFHHAVHTLLTHEADGYYADFGSLEDLALAWTRGMTYAGQYSAYRKRRHGRPTEGLETHQVVVCVQNHDQVGNRMLGERLSSLVDFEKQKLAAGLLILGPYLPLLFMGEEYGETAPFQYFVSHGDPDLQRAVREGRKREFESFGWSGSPPDPQSVDTFEKAKLHRELQFEGRHAVLRKLYKALLTHRKEHAPARGPASVLDDVLLVHDGPSSLTAFHFGDQACTLATALEAGRWECAFNSAHERWGGPGSSAGEQIISTGRVQLALASWSFVVYTHSGEGPSPRE